MKAATDPMKKPQSGSYTRFLVSAIPTLRRFACVIEANVVLEGHYCDSGIIVITVALAVLLESANTKTPA
jgi:hypothetical protein